MDLYKELPSLEFNVKLNEKGSRTNVTYTGDFKFKIPDNNDLAEMDKRRALMSLGLDVNLEATTILYYEKLSYLQCILLDSPKWWKDSKEGSLLLDANIIAVLYDAAIDEEEKWKKAVWGDAPESVVTDKTEEPGS